MAEGNCFKYSDSEKNQCFLRETLYFSVYAAENLQATFKIKFGFESHAFIELKKEQSIIKIQNTNEIKDITRYMLNEQISSFFSHKKISQFFFFSLKINIYNIINRNDQIKKKKKMEFDWCWKQNYH